MLTTQENSVAALGALGAQIERLDDLVASGDVWFDGPVLDQMVSLLDFSLSMLDRVKADAASQREPRSSMLGDNPVGIGMTQKFHRRAVGTDYSFVEVLDAYTDQVRKTREALHRTRDVVAVASRDGEP